MEHEPINILKNEGVIFHPEDDTTRLSVRFDGKMDWLSQERMIDLLSKNRSVISRHIATRRRQNDAGPSAGTIQTPKSWFCLIGA